MGAALADHIHRADPSLVARTIGLILSVCVVVGWIGFKLIGD